MSIQAEPGTVGNLTVDEELKLREAWAHLLRMGGTPGVSHTSPDRSDEFLTHVKDKTPEGFRKSLWEFILCEHPDAVIIRFLRARDWDVKNAMDMLVSAVDWHQERRINPDVVQAGEGVGLKTTRTKDEESFIMQYHSGKSYIRGVDNDDNPIYIIRVRRL